MDRPSCQGSPRRMLSLAFRLFQPARTSSHVSDPIAFFRKLRWGSCGGAGAKGREIDMFGTREQFSISVCPPTKATKLFLVVVLYLV